MPALIEDMCDYVNDNWDTKTAIHLAAYVMWRLNWIHPFDDGNGRTSRIVSYLILCAHLGSRLPGSKTIPDQISENKDPYYKALESADQTWKQGKLDLAALEKLLEDLLAAQLVSIMEQAKGGPVT
ncbi:Fic family protein [Inquilinus sp. NPDC058860]|uniref:Fic family protein n=1 Tax=Inquilinus sp. NPDC058860 TaxID=3346652 RepID=UPI00367A7BCD